MGGVVVNTYGLRQRCGDFCHGEQVWPSPPLQHTANVISSIIVIIVMVIILYNLHVCVQQTITY